MSARKLYTEADVRAMEPGGELALSADTIATPSALDLAFAKGIRVRWPDGSVSPGAGIESKDCLWHRILESDGRYVVEVVDGRATIHRETQSGPVSFGTDTLEAHRQ